MDVACARKDGASMTLSTDSGFVQIYNSIDTKIWHFTGLKKYDNHAQ